jgi:hypothetical protein
MRAGVRIQFQSDVATRDELGLHVDRQPGCAPVEGSDARHVPAMSSHAAKRVTDWLSGFSP